MRVGIVNDVPMIAEGLARMIRQSGTHEVAWIAYDGDTAVDLALNNTPDVILMDLIMPGTDGVEATRRIMVKKPCPILVVTSSVNENIDQVFRAMGCGAIDAISTPILTSHGSQRDLELLLRKIETVSQAASATLEQLNAKRQHCSMAPKATAKGLLAVGASAGGPRALVSLFKNLERGLPIAVVVIQHVNRQFAPRLADWLNTRIDWPVQIAHSGDPLEADRVYLAVSRDHLVITESGHLVYHSEPIECPYRPSVNACFDSVATHWKRPACGVLLSGMGVDGVTGLKNLRDVGHYTIAQDQKSSVVYQLPKTAKESKAAIDILSVEEMGPAIHAYFKDKL